MSLLGRGGGAALRLLLVVVAVRFVAPDLAADRTALLAFRAAVGPGLPWDVTAAGGSPCRWRGVGCDDAAGGVRVVALQLPGAGLRGQVPVGTVGNLTALRTLSLRFNALSGAIPADIGNCGELRYVYLQGNQFAGAIPAGFFSLRLMQRLDLSRNRISGGVSPEFSKLRRLATLYLQSNSLNGALPADLVLPMLQLFNVSDNELNGPVPASLAGRPASAFSGTGLCGAPLSPCPTPSSPPPAAAQDSKGSSKLSAVGIAGIVAGSVVALFVALSVILMICFRRKRKAGGRSTEMPAASPEMVAVARRPNKSDLKRSRSSQTVAGDGKKLVFVGVAPEAPYELEALLQASAEVLGKGWLGSTYCATIDSGSSAAAVVTVKRLREFPIPEMKFRGMVAGLGELRHENLVPLRAYFYSKQEKLLVYDHVVRATGLSSLLHGGGANGGVPLGFTTRARIALVSARGVAFIHAAGGGSSSHGNIKASNILVTEARDGAYVTDYGLVQLVGAGVPLKRVTGYHAPEVTDARRTSQQADVYSFGVLLLELLTGKVPANSLPEVDGAVDLPRWVRTAAREDLTRKVYDAAIAGEAHVQEEMASLLQLATDCTEKRPDRRPAMADVAARIEQVVDSALRRSDSDDFHSASGEQPA